MKTLKLLLVVSLFLAVVVSCAPTPAPTEPPPPPAEEVEVPESPTIAGIKDRGVLRVGTAQHVPQAYMDPNTGELAGLAVSLGREAADRLGVPDVEVVETSWDAIVAGLQADKYDVVMAGLFETDARKEVIDFVTFRTEGICFMVRSDNDAINTLEDLASADVTIATVTGSGSEQTVQKEFPMVQLESVPVEAGGAGAPVDLVLTGRADASQVDSYVSLAWDQRYPELKVVPSDCFDNAPFAMPVGYGLNKGDPGWKQFLDELMADSKQLIEDEYRTYAAFEFIFPGEPTPVPD